MRWIALLIACVACSADEDLDATEEAQSAQSMWQRPVMLRVWQNERHVAPDAATVADRIRHANAIGGPKSPTIVSGAIRLARETALTDPMLADWKALRDQFPNAAFDFALNICDYDSADPQQHNPGNVIEKMRQIEARFAALEKANPGRRYRPDAWFFDFYDRPFTNPDCRTTQNPSVMFTAMAKWAHGTSGGKRKQLVGGNIWGDTAPPGADFIAVPDEKGIAHTLGKLQAIGPGVMRLTHVENNPQKCADDDPKNPSTELCQSNNGDRLIWRTKPDERASYHHAFQKAQTPTLRYMTPIFFPMSAHLGASGTNAFDAVANARASDLPSH